MDRHPPCGLYRTTRALERVPPGALVYFHDHGDPGPGIYLPRAWSFNRVTWEARGVTVPGPAWSATLEPLPDEGLYRVVQGFACCEQRCVQYQPGQLVQLGYDGNATPILFVPEWTSSGLGFPEQGTRLERSRLQWLERLQVKEQAVAPQGGGIRH